MVSNFFLVSWGRPRQIDHFMWKWSRKKPWCIILCNFIIRVRLSWFKKALIMALETQNKWSIYHEGKMKTLQWKVWQELQGNLASSPSASNFLISQYSEFPEFLSVTFDKERFVCTHHSYQVIPLGNIRRCSRK